jgi:hypothetical protein
VDEKNQLWIGLVHLKPLKKDGLEGSAGAYTNILTWACDPTSFRAKAETIAATMELYVAEIEDAEPFSKRFPDSVMSEDVEDMRSRAEHNPDAIVYGTFHHYLNDDA